ncbi:hypothetical protein N7470_010410 [Penicillium chermesinum]|nr:hypothetical protein N7470_010410 [Penicillium chermesinum]
MSAIKVAIASNSMGKSVAGHTIERKLEAAKAHGFDGVEVAFECVEANATQFNTMATRDARLRASAADIYEKAQSLDLKLIIEPIQRFRWTEESTASERSAMKRPRGESIRVHGKKSRRFLRVSTSRTSGTVLTHSISPLKRPGIHSTHLLPSEARDLDDLYRTAWMSSKRTVSPEEYRFLQLSDATTADQEQKGYPNTDLDQPAYMTQSRNCRVFPCEERLGGSLPVMEVAKAVFDMGYTGWVSMEVFTRTCSMRETLFQMTGRDGEWNSWKNVALRCGLDRRVKTSYRNAGVTKTSVAI